jgi:phage gp45-like
MDMSGIATVRTGELIEESKDQGPFRIARVQVDGDEKDVILVNDHGLVSAPLKGSQMLLLQADGEDGKIYAIALAPPKDRIDGNKPGENRAKNLKTGALFEQTDEKRTNLQDETIFLKAKKIVLESDDIRFGSDGASRELALKDTVDDQGHANVGNLATKVKAE